MQTGFGVHPASYLMCTGLPPPTIKLTAHLHPVPENTWSRETTAILVGFHGFPHSLQANVAIVPLFGHSEALFV
jgi:hypothetical protein